MVPATVSIDHETGTRGTATPPPMAVDSRRRVWAQIATEWVRGGIQLLQPQRLDTTFPCRRQLTNTRFSYHVNETRGKIGFPLGKRRLCQVVARLLPASVGPADVISHEHEPTAKIGSLATLIPPPG